MNVLFIEEIKEYVITEALFTAHLNKNVCGWMSCFVRADDTDTDDKINIFLADRQ